MSVTVAFLLVSARASNDDLSLRKIMLPNNGQDGGGVGVGCGADGTKDLGGELDLKLSPAEVAVLCWERGLLRSQHWEGGDMRWTMLGHEISEKETDAMLNRWGNVTPTWDRCSSTPFYVPYLESGIGPRFLLNHHPFLCIPTPSGNRCAVLPPDFVFVLLVPLGAISSSPPS